MKKSLILGLAALSLTTLPGCTNEEVLTSIAVIGAVAIALPSDRPVGRGDYRDNYHDQDGYHRGDDHRDNWHDGRRDGGFGRDDGFGRDGGFRRDDRGDCRCDVRRDDRIDGRIDGRVEGDLQRAGRNNFDVHVANVLGDAQPSKSANVAAAFKSHDARVLQIANKYEISDYAATYIARALILAKQKDASGIKDIGLSQDDVALIYQGKQVDAAKVNVVSAKLALSTSETNRLLKEMTEDIQTAKTVQ